MCLSCSCFGITYMTHCTNFIRAEKPHHLHDITQYTHRGPEVHSQVRCLEEALKQRPANQPPPAMCVSRRIFRSSRSVRIPRIPTGQETDVSAAWVMGNLVRKEFFIDPT